MAFSWTTLAECRMRAAEARGELSSLRGAGKRLPERPGDALVDTGEALGYRMMAEAGALPEEFCLKAEAEAVRQAVQSATDDEKKATFARLAEAELRYAIAREARISFMK